MPNRCINVAGICEQKLGPDSPLVAQSMNNLAQLYKDRGDYVAARPLLERALRAVREDARAGSS